MRRPQAASAVLGIVLWAAICAAQPTIALEAGAARVSIVPPADVGHVSLGGYSARKDGPYEGVHDEIFARALVLRDGDTRVAIVTLDLLLIPRFMHEDVRAQAGDLALGPGELIITASHTHAAPQNMARHGDIFPLAFGKYNEKLYEWTVGQIVAALGQAAASLRPARIGGAQATLDGMNRNRRGDDVVDAELTVVKVCEAEPAAPRDSERVIAVLINFAAHPTILGSDNMLISGDWVGAMERAMEQKLPAGAVALYCNGALGDQSVAGGFGGGFDGVRRYGERLATEALQLAATCELQADDALAMAHTELSLPEPVVSPAFGEIAGTQQPLPPQLVGIALAALFPRRAPLHAVRLGDDVMIITVPGEAIAQIGLELKQRMRRAGIAKPFIAGLANTYCGYILTPEEYDEGGYEAGVSFYGGGFSPVLLDALSGLIEQAAQSGAG